ncbi:uncharacterized protein LOC107868096 isoform X1 [Capsicum annuum]|uniref:uncharacterized protein LOC107868096 isoform X1 n=1 Tax=Capsicum annuum TaxID=4072 RepID=UPI001FB1064F|nr:uncharacterized protein LOC107868096 isoform X1 [Capsicum annuum]
MPAFSQGHFQLFVLLLCRTEKTELILQKTLNYGETLNGGARLDIDAEKKVAMRVLGIRSKVPRMEGSIIIGMDCHGQWIEKNNRYVWHWKKGEMLEAIAMTV